MKQETADAKLVIDGVRVYSANKVAVNTTFHHDIDCTDAQKDDFLETAHHLAVIGLLKTVDPLLHNVHDVRFLDAGFSMTDFFRERGVSPDDLCETFRLNEISRTVVPDRGWQTVRRVSQEIEDGYIEETDFLGKDGHEK